MTIKVILGRSADFSYVPRAERGKKETFRGGGRTGEQNVDEVTEAGGKWKDAEEKRRKGRRKRGRMQQLRNGGSITIVMATIALTM